jgi:hypothetical protein
MATTKKSTKRASKTPAKPQPTTKRVYLLWHEKAGTTDGSSGDFLAVVSDKAVANAWFQLSPHTIGSPNTHIIYERRVRAHLETIEGMTIDNPLDLIRLVEIEMKLAAAAAVK